jgi:predicted dinucleotide-binding enzyme
MYVIMGGSGHVGSAISDVLLKRNAAVTIISHDGVEADPPLS